MVWADYLRYSLGIPTAEYNSMPVGMFLDIVSCHGVAMGGLEPVSGAPGGADEEIIISIE